MPEYYHTQPCFCLPCRALKSESKSATKKRSEQIDAVEVKPKKKGGRPKKGIDTSD